MPQSKPAFEKATETLDQRKTRLDAQAKQLDDALRKPPAPRLELRPKGQMRRDGDAHARNVVMNKRVNVQRDLDQAKDQIKARDDRKKEVTKTQTRGR